VSRAGWPAQYEIRVESVLHERWSAWFEGLRIEIVGDMTVLSGSVPDLSALHGILDKVCNLGLSVVSVRRIPSNEDPAGDVG
jgi:hypothetical protein